MRWWDWCSVSDEFAESDEMPASDKIDESGEVGEYHEISSSDDNEMTYNLGSWIYFLD